jgi:superfamily II DNA/RNA helicase
MSFDSFSLNPLILKAIAEEGYTEPTPIPGTSHPRRAPGR